MAAGEHYGASRYYGEALKQTPGTWRLQWNYAEACRLSNQYAEAADYYDKVQRKDHARKHPEALRWLAEMQMSTGHYDDAEATWAKVKQKERKKDSFIAQRADNGLEGCRLAKAMLADPDTVVRIEHLPMPVNSFDSEFGARTGPDSALYFTSLRGEVNADGEVQDTASYHARHLPDAGKQRHLGGTRAPARQREQRAQQRQQQLEHRWALVLLLAGRRPGPVQHPRAGPAPAQRHRHRGAARAGQHRDPADGGELRGRRGALLRLRPPRRTGRHGHLVGAHRQAPCSAMRSRWAHP